MRSMIWLSQPEMSLYSGAQQEAVQESFREAGWSVRVRSYHRRLQFRRHDWHDLLVWPFIPSQLDIWSARLSAGSQVGMPFQIERRIRGLPKLEHWLAPSPSLKKDLESLGADPQHITVMDSAPKSVARPRWACDSQAASRNLRHDLGLPAQSRLIYAPGPLLLQNGLHLAIWALNILNYLQPEAHLLLHGTGADEERLRAFSRAIDGSSRTHRLDPGWRVCDLVAQADQVWLPQECDGLPDALFFALELGRPILAAPRPALLDWLRDGENALLIAGQRPPQWAAASHRLFEDKTLANRLAALAKRAASHRPGRRSPAATGAVFPDERLSQAA